MYSNFQVDFLTKAKTSSTGVGLLEVSTLPFETCQPVRRPRAYHGQRHFPNLYFFEKMSKLILCESRNERAAVMLLDFNPIIDVVATQPFRLHYKLKQRSYVHYPDIYTRDRYGRVCIIDVKALDFVDDADFQRQAEATKIACDQIGWGYEIQTEPHPTFFSNVSWLSGYRSLREEKAGYADSLVDNAHLTEHSIGSLIRSVDGPAYLVRPILFWLLWRQVLNVDLYLPMTDSTPILTEARGGHSAER
ncbi:hypothetical protein Dcar01_01835 [Deinococcus carri]|uniref:TnsA endonuclease N-terminal domain-containing protein n=1 Tax=Deinococcus carri TaxID=1211323 RepID=A0ABP9W711_9DEIO